MEKQKGFSLVELLVVIFIFSILGVVVARSLALSLHTSNKSESVSIVKENVEYASSTMERLLRNSQSISCPSALTVDYIDENGLAGRFACTESGTDGYIASGSASPIRITSNDVDVLCSGQTVFTCIAATANTPASLIINLTANHAALGAAGGGAQVNVQTRVQLRNYD